RIVARQDAWQPVIVPWQLVGVTPRDLRFELPAASLSGKVVEEATEAPVANADVYALTAGQQLGRNDAVTVATDAAGNFQLTGLAYGNLRLEVRHPQHGTAVRTVVVGPQTGQQDFELGPRSAVFGRLAAQNGVAVAGATLALRSAADELVEATV